MRKPVFVLERVGTDPNGQPVMGVQSDADRLTEREKRMEVCRPQVRLCNCGGCGRDLISEADARQVRRLAEAVRQLFPQDVMAGRVKGRPSCRACIRPKTMFPPPVVPAPAAPSMSL